jgi:catechol 2,3-dioxygenase-like lactoylglutathione lyase family enzyme
MPSRVARTISGFDHVDVKVRDLRSAREFFEALGLEVMGANDSHAFLLLGDQVLGLRRVARGAAKDGVDHVALRVTSAAAARRALSRAGIRPVRTKRRAESYSWFLAGPEGLEVELVSRPQPHRHPVH